jgi:hypothetical protein
MPADALPRLQELIGTYTVITFIPDIDRYQRIRTNKTGTCIFKGCTEPVAWEDAHGSNFLCEGHYRVIRQWIMEARKGLISTGQSALFRPEK